MTAGKTVSLAELDDLLRTFERSAMHVETQDFYPVDQAEFDRFLAGNPRLPSEVGWWSELLGEIAELTAQGRRRRRVRVLAEPPTDYQRWLLWADRWHGAAGEDIRYIPRSRALAIGLPLDHDWWLLDDSRVVDMRFAADQELPQMTLVTDPVAVELHRRWWGLAVRNAAPAEQISAA